MNEWLRIRWIRFLNRLRPTRRSKYYREAIFDIKRMILKKKIRTIVNGSYSIWASPEIITIFQSIIQQTMTEVILCH